ncbi:MAG: ATP-binding protein, partial [Bdellovibrionota bacterium]
VDLSGRGVPEWLGERRQQFPLTQRALENAARGLLTFETFRALGPTPVRVITMPVIVDGRITDNLVQVGASLESVEQALHKLWISLLIVLPACLLVAGLGGWMLANQTLKPVDRITRAVQRINAESLNERLEDPQTDDEIGRLVATFNETLERLGKSFEQIRSFTADASHELRTPLTILKGEIELALRRPRQVAEYQEILASSLEEIGRLVRITQDLLMLAKTDAGTAAPLKEPVNLSRLSEEVALQLHAIAEERNVTLEALPGVRDVEIEGDPFRLKQMLSNLVENAIHYTPPGGRVVVRVDRGNAFYAILEVSDTGIGIAKEEQARIFERFYRTDKARNRREGGTGLGLAIVKSVVDAHGGRIEVDSEPQRGSTFTLFLPYRAAQAGTQLPLPTPAARSLLLH